MMNWWKGLVYQKEGGGGGGGGGREGGGEPLWLLFI